MTTALDQARRRVERSRWIPLALLGLLLAYGCAVHPRPQPRPRQYRGETALPSVAFPAFHSLNAK